MSQDSALVDRETMVTSARAVVDAATALGASARLLGGIAIALRCPSARPPGPLVRTYSDIDVVCRSRDVRRLTEAFGENGFAPNERFNANQAGRRMRFHCKDRAEAHADVFVDSFQMCHTLRLGKRLDLDARTLAPADLLLTKLQVARLTHKDVTDILSLLLDQPLTQDDSGINMAYLVGFLASDWGWWRTATDTLARVPALCAEEPLRSHDIERITGTVSALLEEIDRARKGWRWRARSMVGERLAWRADPEELAC